MPDKLREIQNQLTQIKERQLRDHAKLETLEKEVKLARGTRDVKVKLTPSAGLTTQQLTDAIVRLTKEKPLTLQEIATMLHNEPQVISNAINALKKNGHTMLNVGEPRKAKWYYVPKYKK